MWERLHKLPNMCPPQEGSLLQCPATPRDTPSNRELRGKPQAA